MLTFMKQDHEFMARKTARVWILPCVYVWAIPKQLSRARARAGSAPARTRWRARARLLALARSRSRMLKKSGKRPMMDTQHPIPVGMAAPAPEPYTLPGLESPCLENLLF